MFSRTFFYNQLFKKDYLLYNPMIKKFNEYFSDNTFLIKDIISIEEIRDQFLRLVEVLKTPFQIFPIVENGKKFILPGFNNSIHN